jgi:hypothetical protein
VKAPNDPTRNDIVLTAENGNVLVNGVVVGSYSFPGGAGGGTTRTFTPSFTFAAIAPGAGSTFTIRLEATTTVCSGGGSWNWLPDGTAVLGLGDIVLPGVFIGLCLRYDILRHCGIGKA